MTVQDDDMNGAVHTPEASDVARPGARPGPAVRPAVRPERVAVALILVVAIASAAASILVDPSSALVLAMAALNGAVGTVLALRRPSNPIGWIFLGVLLVFTIQSAAEALGGTAVQQGGPLPSGMPLVLIWVETWAFQVLFGLYYGLTLVFPSGHLPGGRIGRVARVSLLVPIAGVVVSAFGPHLAGIYAADTLGRSLDNPFALLPFPDGLDHLFEITTVLLLVAGTISIIVRFRRAHGIEREQMKWFVAALSLTGVLVFAVTLVVVTSERPDPNIWFLAVLGYAAIPPAVGVAVLRYRLFEIDRIISRTITYGFVSVVLVAIFTIAILLFQALLTPLTGGNTIAVAASTLVVATLFQPLRSRVQNGVDRRFNRSRYDAERTTSTFVNRLRDQVDLGMIRLDLIGAVAASLDPKAVGLWVRGEGGTDRISPRSRG